jgi:hypothetical protein
MGVGHALLQEAEGVGEQRRASRWKESASVWTAICAAISP